MRGVTLMENTERPATITSGTNELVKVDPAAVARRVRALLDGGRPSATVPPLWDGHAAERVLEVLEKLM